MTGLHTPLCDLLGCEYPILQAGMGGPARAELAAAVSGAGGFGCLGMVRESPELITQEIAALRRQTDRPFAVNLIPAATEPELFRTELDACIAAGVGCMTFFWTVLPEAVARAKEAGMTVLHQVGTIEAARAAEAAGADAIIAQGVEAGGHVMGDATSLVLIPAIARVVDIPVIGSGGFASGASLIAALALGAEGIHCGTAFLATEESFAHQVHKARITAASIHQTLHTDAYAINWPKGSPVRVLRNAMTDSLGNRLFGHDPAEIPREQIAEEDGRPLYRWSTDSPLRNMQGDLENLAMFAGQIAGEVTTTEPAADVVARIVKEAQEALTRLPRSG